MISRKRLNSSMIMGATLMVMPPIVPIESDNNSFESKVSNCQSCINKDEGRCLSNGLTTKFPSGMCGNYEPPGDWDNYYNVIFGPLIEGVFRGPKIIDTRPYLGYTEIEATLHKI